MALSKKQKQKQKLLFIYVAVLFLLFGFLAGAFSEKYISSRKSPVKSSDTQNQAIDLSVLQDEVIPQRGYKFKIKWGDLGKKMIEDGVIDETKLAQAISGTDSMPLNVAKYMKGNVSEIEINAENAQFWVDVLWGLGLANKNKILEEGPMVSNGSAANFASTGGYTLSQVDPMQIYSKYSYIELNEKQQQIVKEIAESVFRPCCGNSTAFPDCNHGMAALGLIELMVSQGKSKDEIYKTVLAFNSYWFPQTYLDIAYHFKKAGRSYASVPASQILSKTFSSAMGYQAIRREVGQIAWPALKGAGSCGA